MVAPLADALVTHEDGSMAEIVNLRRVKKQRARAAEAAAAAENRTRHGRSAAEKAADRLERTRASAHLDGHRKDRPPETDS
jgi:hypothetical protein